MIGLSFGQRLCPVGVDPYDTCGWEFRDVIVKNSKGEVVFEQRNARLPVHFSEVSGQIVVSKYFRGAVGTPERETSLTQVIDRVVDTICEWGRLGEYFASSTSEMAFSNDLKYAMLHGYACFNSPVLFNFGLEGVDQQGAACYILRSGDTLDDWTRLVDEETRIFKRGSGSGFDLSPIRSSWESLSGGGWASGPISLMRILDVNAGQIKSGGKTRRAACMRVLSVTHPDLLETREGEPGFVDCKRDQEKAARALVAGGYDPGFNVPGGAYSRVFFQNANHSVRAGDDFFQAVMRDEPWSLLDRFGNPVHTLPAREILRRISEAAWACGDPAFQYDGAIQEWHTLPNSGRITASNPCSEFLHIDSTSCNLYSLRLTAFLRKDGTFNKCGFVHLCRILTVAGEIIVSGSYYPTPTIERETKACRPLGMGYADLGSLLMRLGLPYDSEDGRALASAITSLMTAVGYMTSAEIARSCGGPFDYFNANRTPMLEVIDKHRECNNILIYKGGKVGTESNEIACLAKKFWGMAFGIGKHYGFRNSQVSVIAPTGTISYFLGCDTTGIEPDIALVKMKNLAGGGVVTYINESVSEALERLGYGPDTVTDILNYLQKNGHLEGCPELKASHLPVFDCAFTAPGGSRSVSYTGHLLMMAAVQPFISGALSKTVNVPNDFTIEQVAELYLLGWQLGLKCVAIYRDGSKGSQPLEAVKGGEEAYAPAQLTCPQCGTPQNHDTSGKCMTCSNCGYQAGCSV